MLKFILWVAAILVILGVVYISGPKVPEARLTPVLPTVTSDLVKLEEEINRTEKATPLLKPDNEARIVWAKSSSENSANQAECAVPLPSGAGETMAIGMRSE